MTIMALSYLKLAIHGRKTNGAHLIHCTFVSILEQFKKHLSPLTHIRSFFQQMCQVALYLYTSGNIYQHHLVHNNNKRGIRNWIMQKSSCLSTTQQRLQMESSAPELHFNSQQNILFCRILYLISLPRAKKQCSFLHYMDAVSGVSGKFFCRIQFSLLTYTHSSRESKMVFVVVVLSH